MSTQPSPAEPGAVNNNEGDCDIINGDAGDDAGDDGVVEEGKGDESDSVTSVVQQAQAEFVVPEGIKHLVQHVCALSV